MSSHGHSHAHGGEAKPAETGNKKARYQLWLVRKAARRSLARAQQ